MVFHEPILLLFKTSKLAQSMRVKCHALFTYIEVID